MPAVVNTSPVILLDKIRKLELLARCMEPRFCLPPWWQNCGRNPEHLFKG